MSIVKSGYFGESSKNIKIIKNFIKVEHLFLLQNYVKTIKNFQPEDQVDLFWNDRIHTSEMFLNGNIDLFRLYNQWYFKNIQKEIEKFYKITTKSNGTVSIATWRIGDSLEPHADKEDEMGNPNPFPDNDIASVIYINDDYEGGEIYFPIQDIKIKPSAGDLAFFPGDKNYLHGVTKILSGTRYTIPAFWTVESLLPRLDSN